MSELFPYARTLRMRVAEHEGRAAVAMPAFAGVHGRPGFLHGGAIAALLEAAAWVALRTELAADARFRPINLSVDFMRGGRLEDSFAQADVLRLGRRVAHLRAVAWQDEAHEPFASASVKLLLD